MGDYQADCRGSIDTFVRYRVGPFGRHGSGLYPICCNGLAPSHRRHFSGPPTGGGAMYVDQVNKTTITANSSCLIYPPAAHKYTF